MPAVAPVHSVAFAVNSESATHYRHCAFAYLYGDGERADGEAAVTPHVSSADVSRADRMQVNSTGAAHNIDDRRGPYDIAQKGGGYKIHVSSACGELIAWRPLTGTPAQAIDLIVFSFVLRDEQRRQDQQQGGEAKRCRH